MHWISSRVDLADEDRLGPQETFWELTIANDRLAGARQETLAQFRTFVRGKRILVLVHGYNNVLEDIVRAYSIVERMTGTHVAGFYDAVVGYTWPGGDAPLDWYLPRRRAGLAGPRLGTVLDDLRRSAASIDLMSHSLGARVALKAIDAAARGTVRVHFLLASAVDNESIEGREKYHAATRKTGETLVLHSRHDSILKFGYSAAQWDLALGLHGPEDPGDIAEHSPNVVIGNCKHVIERHGQYKSSVEVYTFLRRWMNGQVQGQFVTVPR